MLDNADAAHDYYHELATSLSDKRALHTKSVRCAISVEQRRLCCTRTDVAACIDVLRPFGMVQCASSA